MASALSHLKTMSPLRSTSVLEDLDPVTCPVCLEVFEKPTSIACGHTFCAVCVIALHRDAAEPICPLCRLNFDPAKRVKNSALDATIHSHKGRCKGCGKKIQLNKLRSHNQSCSKLIESAQAHKFEPLLDPQNSPSTKNGVAAAAAAAAAENRSTFKCPFCGIKNLDSNNLVKHCNEKHQDSSSQVVCPICASMPWGDPTMLSSNFLQHLNLRHRFEYHTFVDYDQDDDEMLRRAIEASLNVDDEDDEKADAT